MFRRPKDPFPLALALVCAAWTSQSLWFGKSLEDAGAATRHLIWRGDVWRIFTTILCHGGLTHLIVNCLGLLFVGPFVSRGFGNLLFLAAVLFSALAGLAASLITHEPNMMLVGISGGVVGLLGVILAVEWRVSTGFMAFLRQRNTVVVIVVIVANAILAVIIESRTEMRIDHAAHAGGLVFGLVGTLALLGKRRADGVIPTRKGRALAAALLLAVLPVAYASFPQWTKGDIPYLRFYAERALARGDTARAIRLYEQIVDLDPKNPIANAWLANKQGDASRLENIREPVGDHEKMAVLKAHLFLAIDHLEANRPAEALALIRKVSIRGPRFGDLWLAFAQTADQGGAREVAAYAYNEAALSLPKSQAWRAAAQALAAQNARIVEEGISPEERLLRCLVGADLALGAAGALAFIQEAEERTFYETAASAAALALGRFGENFARMENPPDGWRELQSKVKRVYQRLADNSEGSPQEAGYLHGSALAWWRQIRGGPTESGELEAVGRRFRAALIAAKTHGNARLQAKIEAWYAARGLPVPNLADQSGGD